MLRKIIVVPDSFKGSASSAELCGWITAKLSELLPGCETRAIPVADGGEGTVDSFIAAVSGSDGATAEKVSLEVCGRTPDERTRASFAVINYVSGIRRAVVETASCAGVADGYSPMRTTTYGVGEQLRHAVEFGCSELAVGLGGSCTNDGGAGLAAALGVKFYNRCGREFIPVGGTLCDIADLNVTAACEFLRGIKLTAMCDVDNPTVGPRGAAYVFAPQKGALPDELPLLDSGLRNLCEVTARKLGIDAATLPGGGAAGGLGAGLFALLGAKLVPGIDALLDAADFNRALETTDLVITGEGRIDTQSLGGKAVIGVARRCKAAGVPVVALVGGAELDNTGLECVYAEGVTAVLPINRRAEPFETARLHVRENVTQTVGDMVRLININDRNRII